MGKLWLAGAAVALASCGAAGEMDAAGDQVAVFHSGYDAENYGPLWDRSAPTMKALTPKEQFLGLMEAVRARLGAVESTSRTGFNVNYASEGSQVTLTYQTVFENGEGTETFIYDAEDPPRLLGWHVVSPALFEADSAPATKAKAKAEQEPE